LKGKYHFGCKGVRREGNNETDLKGIGSEGVDWIQLAQDRVQ